MFRKLNKQGGAKLIDAYIDLVKEKLNNCEEWKAEADEICKQAHNDYLNTVANDDDDDNEVSGFRNLQPPVFTRWHSVLNGVLWLRKHYVLIYFMAVAIIQKEGSKSELYKTACDIVSLMSMRPNARSIVESGDVATAAAVEDDVATSSALKPGDSPLLLVQCHFLCAFGECFFKPYFEMAMQSDPKFGTDSHGHLSRLLVERCYVMMDELRTMMADNAWQSYPEFRSYMKGREGLPLLGNIDAGGREFMDAAATAFFDIFLSSMVKHVEEQWTSEMLLPYIIGGSPELAKEFLLWLRACEDGQLEADNFHFTDKEIELEIATVHYGPCNDEDTTQKGRAGRNGSQ